MCIPAVTAQRCNATKTTASIGTFSWVLIPEPFLASSARTKFLLEL